MKFDSVICKGSKDNFSVLHQNFTDVALFISIEKFPNEITKLNFYRVHPTDV